MRIRSGVNGLLFGILFISSSAGHVHAEDPWYNRLTNAPKKLADGSLDPTNRHNDFGSYIDTHKLNIIPRYETDKFDLKAKIEDGGWHVAWAQDVAETDVAEGVVAAGVSIYSANPAAFIEWIHELVERTIHTIENDAARFPDEIRRDVNALAERVIREAIQGQSAKQISKNFGGIGIKAGAIRYSGANKVGDQIISRTWGIKPYIGIRITKPGGGVVQPMHPQGGPGHLGEATVFRARSGYQFARKSGSYWVALAPNGAIVADLEAVERTDRYLGLKSHNPFPHIRLFADHVEEFIPQRSKEWQGVEAGEWVR